MGNRSVSPGASSTSTGTLYGNKLIHAATYYNTLTGSFKAVGYTLTFSLDDPETIRFKCPSGTANCFFP